jgi:hypothetical protein
MAGGTVIGDGLAVGTGMTAIMAAEAAERIIVTEIVRVSTPGHPHVREDVAQVEWPPPLGQIARLPCAWALIDLSVISADKSR